jgi:hypothetical protein
VELVMLAAGLRERLPAQLVLGAVYALGFFGAIAGSALADGGALAQALLGAAPASADPEPDGAMAAGMLLSVLLYLPSMMLLWFAPVLVAWHGAAPAKALFYSAVAFWLNLRAFVVYALGLAAVLFLMVGALTLLLALLPAGAPAAGVQAAILPMALVLLPTLFASYYASYRDVFGIPEGG